MGHLSKMNPTGLTCSFREKGISKELGKGIWGTCNRKPGWDNQEHRGPWALPWQGGVRVSPGLVTLLGLHVTAH